METWKDIPGTDYSVSDMGRVASRKFGKWRVLRPSRASCGYSAVSFCEEGRIKTTMVHRLVALAFAGHPPTSAYQVNHKDGDKANNRADNLEWVTPSENKIHSLRVLKRGRCFNDAFRSGRKFNEDQVRGMRARCESGESQSSVAADYGVLRETVSQIVRRKSWAWLT